MNSATRVVHLQFENVTDGSSQVADDRLLFAVAAEAMASDDNTTRPLSHTLAYLETLVPNSMAIQRLRTRYAPQSEAELGAIRRSVQRGQPFGGDAWRAKVARQLGLDWRTATGSREQAKRRIVEFQYKIGRSRQLIGPNFYKIVLQRTLGPPGSRAKLRLHYRFSTQRVRSSLGVLPGKGPVQNSRIRYFSGFHVCVQANELRIGCESGANRADYFPSATSARQCR